MPLIILTEEAHRAFRRNAGAFVNVGVLHADGRWRVTVPPSLLRRIRARSREGESLDAAIVRLYDHDHVAET